MTLVSTERDVSRETSTPRQRPRTDGSAVHDERGECRGCGADLATVYLRRDGRCVNCWHDHVRSLPVIPVEPTPEVLLRACRFGIGWNILGFCSDDPERRKAAISSQVQGMGGSCGSEGAMSTTSKGISLWDHAAMWTDTPGLLVKWSQIVDIARLGARRMPGSLIIAECGLWLWGEFVRTGRYGRDLSKATKGEFDDYYAEYGFLSDMKLEARDSILRAGIAGTVTHKQEALF